MSVPADALRLYDEHAARLYALALRITGDPAQAAAVLEEVFASNGLPAELGALVRITREISLRRYDRSSASSVPSPARDPHPRQIVEDAFYRGMSVGDLAREWQLPEETIRRMIADGLTEIRNERRADH